jgi:hypothetical protein
MPLTISKPTTRNTGRASVRPKRVRGDKVFRKWINLANGKIAYVRSAVAVPDEALKILKSAGICVSAKLQHKPNECREMNALLKKMGAQKLTREDRRRFRPHLTVKK